MPRRFLAVLSAFAMVLAGLIVSPGGLARADEPNSAPRILFSDDFEANDGAKWTSTVANTAVDISFAGGMAHIYGGGPENRILSKDVIVANDFTLDTDFYLHQGNTNAHNKFGFLADAQAANRFQVSYNATNGDFYLERVAPTGMTRLATSSGDKLPSNTQGEPHHITITVEGDRVTVVVNGVERLDVADTGTADAQHGRLVFASQYPAQDWSIDNVVVTTTEPEAVGEYEVTLQTSTNGVTDTDPATAGGTLTANRATGNAGDEVTLSYTVKPGYVFAGYDSFVTATGTSTDGLLTITNERFVLDAKTGSVTIVAKFVTEPDDPNVLFKDYFYGELNDHGQYTFSHPATAAIVDGELVLTPGTEPASVLVDNSAWNEPSSHQVELSIRKANAAAGTVQVAFRTGETLADRYVLALNGSRAMLRHLSADGTNEELFGVNYAFDQSARKILIDVTDGVVSVTANGAPLLSWTLPDGADWAGTVPGFAVVNMTEDAAVAVDNIIVRRNPITVDATVQVTNDGEADPDLTSGAVVLSQYKTSAGATLTWTVHPKGGYAFDSITFEGREITDGQLIVPEGMETGLELVANFVPVQTEARTYYVDSEGGDDANSGLSETDAWASLGALDRTFNPGDRILLKRDSVFTGKEAALRFRGSGSEAAPITVSTYGGGNRPQLNAAGAVTNVIELYNQEHIHIQGLEITNTDPAFESSFELNANTNRTTMLRGVNVFAEDFGVAHGIVLRDLYLHDINGNLAAKWNGGIFFDVRGTIVGEEILGVPTKFDDVLIADNVLERVDRSGIKLVSSVWANQSRINAPSVPLNWYPSTNVVVRNNQLRWMGGDAITVRDTDGALIEHNLARHSRYQNTGYNAGIWPFEATNTVMQYNEVSHTHGVQDGQGMDLDHVSAYSVAQYNYSHNNEGGFMLIMNGFPHTAPTVRYNISQNDADKTFEFARGTAAGTMIYNNTIYSDSLLFGPRGGVLDLANSAAGTGNREIFLFNNVFHYPAGQPFYVGEAATMKTKAKLYNNAYYGGIEVPAQETQPITADPKLPGLGSAPTDDTDSARTGATAPERFAGYVPEVDSPLIGAGVSIEDVLTHFGGTSTDRRDMSPTQIHALALEGQSIDFAAGRFLPEVDGVTYGQDFLGNPLPDWTDDAGDSGITVGAVQVAEDDEVEPTPEPTDEPTPTPTTEPTDEPTDEPSQEPTPTPTVTPSTDPTPQPTVTVTPPSGEENIYTVPGFHQANGRWWHTVCEPYSQTVRCRTEIWGTTVTQVNGVFKQHTGWIFNNLTYLPHMKRAEWGANPLANTGSWTATDGRKWRTECDTALTGRGGCRSFITASVIEAKPKAGGGYTYGWVTKEVFNNMVRFKQ